jgi:hypothetical protein
MKDLDVDGKVMSGYILEIYGKKLWTGRLLWTCIIVQWKDNFTVILAWNAEVIN